RRWRLHTEVNRRIAALIDSDVPVRVWFHRRDVERGANLRDGCTGIHREKCRADESRACRAALLLGCKLSEDTVAGSGIRREFKNRCPIAIRSLNRSPPMIDPVVSENPANVAAPINSEVALQCPASI